MAELGHCIGGRQHIHKVVVELRIGEDEGRCHDQSACCNVGDEGTNHSIDLLMFDPTGGEALVNDIGLLEEELPGCYRRADNRDNGQQRCRVDAPTNYLAGDSYWPSGAPSGLFSLVDRHAASILHPDPGSETQLPQTCSLVALIEREQVIFLIALVLC